VLVRPWLVGPMLGRAVWFHDSFDNTCNIFRSYSFSQLQTRQLNTFVPTSYNVGVL
jgi:hypothetical protein